MEGKDWRQIVDESELALGLAALFDRLNDSGWLARRRYGQYGVAFWPNERRRDQVSIDTRYAAITPKLEEYAAHTGLDLMDLAIDGEEGGRP
jgi:hypothetical protein